MAKFDQRLPLRLGRDVDRLRVDLGAAFAPVSGDLLDLLGLDIRDHQTRLLGLEAGNDRLADALGGAGDDHHLVLQPLAIGRFGHGGE